MRLRVGGLIGRLGAGRLSVPQDDRVGLGVPEGWSAGGV
jgi:hypothetical protein